MKLSEIQCDEIMAQLDRPIFNYAIGGIKLGKSFRHFIPSARCPKRYENGFKTINENGKTRKIMLIFGLLLTLELSNNSVNAAQRDTLNLNNLANVFDIIPKDLHNTSLNVIESSQKIKGISDVNLSIVANANRNTEHASYAIAEGENHSTTEKTQSSNVMSKNINSVFMNSKEVSDERSGPYFEKSVSKNVTALLGKTAYLNCRVKNLGNKTMLLQVSWVRHRDIHLLTVGRYTYTSDQRFRAIHQPQTEDWILQIKYPQHRDSGIYECQVSTTPHMSHYIHLNVVEPSTEIIGAPDLYIESGSTINLTCIILNSPEPPAYIFWNHNSAIINYDSPRGGVSVVTNKGETTTSFLLIKSARPTDSGHYQCNPSNAKSKSVTVHVLNGEFPAAMQRAGQAHHRMSQSHYLMVYLLMHLFSLVSINVYAYIPVSSTKAYFTEWLY